MFRTLLPWLSLALLLTGCLAPLKAPRQPIPAWSLDGDVARAVPPSSLTLSASQKASSPCAVVLLPGSFDHPRDFARHGFADTLKQRHPDLHIVSVDAHMGYYRNRSVVQRLQEDVVGPLKEEGYRVWMAGISLGGLGSLLYAQQSSEQPQLALEGLVALAPFLGHDGLIRDLQDAGGALEWQPPDPLPEPKGRATVGYSLWPWLVDWHEQRQQSGSEMPNIVLAYGLEDSFAPAGEQLAALLPDEHVFIHSGGHDWDAWRPLWKDVVEAGVFDGCAGTISARDDNDS